MGRTTPTSHTMVFRDRREAGRLLADGVAEARPSWPVQDLVVVGLPRGGVPVAYEVATALNCPLDVILVRKLGVPGWPELAMGAIGEDGVRVLDADVLTGVPMAAEAIESATRREGETLEAAQVAIRGVRPREPLTGRCAVIVDDGAATGSTLRAACQVARAHGAALVVAAVPVGAPRALRLLRESADEVVAIAAPANFRAVGQFYHDFSATSDREVRALLKAAAGGAGG